MPSYGTSCSRIMSPPSAHQDWFLDDGKGLKLAWLATRRVSKDGPGGASSHPLRRSCYFRPPAVDVPWIHLAQGQTDRKTLATSGTYQAPAPWCRRATKSKGSPLQIVSELATSVTIEILTWIFPSCDPEYRYCPPVVSKGLK